MSLSVQFQAALKDLLSAPGVLRAEGLPIVARRTQEQGAEIEAAAAMANALCIFIKPPLPKKAVYNAPRVYFSDAEFVIQIIERPNDNLAGVSGYELMDDVITALHWAPQVSGTALGGLLAHPLMLSPRPVDLVADKELRIIEVLFHAPYQLGAPVASAPFELPGLNTMDDLQTAIVTQLRSVLPDSCPAFGSKDKDYTDAIERAGQVLKVQIPPPLPTTALQGLDVPFFPSAKVRVDICECPQINGGELDAYDVLELVAQGLHQQPFDGLLAQPLLIAETPCSLDESLGPDPEDPFVTRRLTVFFEAAFGFTIA